MKKRFRAIAALLAVFAATFPVAAAELPQAPATVAQASARRPVTVLLEGSAICAEQAQLIATSTYVPLRAFCTAMGVTGVDWDDAGTATVSAPGLSISASDGERRITVNDRVFYAPDSVRLVDGSLFVPLRPLARAFGYDVGWDATADCATLIDTNTGWAADASAVYDAQELYWLSRIISAESRGEPIAGQLAVGNVVLNRVQSNEFPDSVYAVIFDTKWGVQFTPVANGTIYQEPSMYAVIAAKLALEGYTVSPHALYFLNPDLATSLWVPQNRPYLFRIGSHAFYA